MSNIYEYTNPITPIELKETGVDGIIGLVEGSDNLELASLIDFSARLLMRTCPQGHLIPKNRSEYLYYNAQVRETLRKCFAATCVFVNNNKELYGYGSLAYRSYSTAGVSTTGMDAKYIDSKIYDMPPVAEVYLYPLGWMNTDGAKLDPKLFERQGDEEVRALSQRISVLTSINGQGAAQNYMTGQMPSNTPDGAGGYENYERGSGLYPTPLPRAYVYYTDGSNSLTDPNTPNRQIDNNKKPHISTPNESGIEEWLFWYEYNPQTKEGLFLNARTFGVSFPARVYRRNQNGEINTPRVGTVRDPQTSKVIAVWELDVPKEVLDPQTGYDNPINVCVATKQNNDDKNFYDTKMLISFHTKGLGNLIKYELDLADKTWTNNNFIDNTEFATHLNDMIMKFDEKEWKLIDTNTTTINRNDTTKKTEVHVKYSQEPLNTITVQNANGLVSKISAVAENSEFFGSGDLAKIHQTKVKLFRENEVGEKLQIDEFDINFPGNLSAIQSFGLVIRLVSAVPPVVPTNEMYIPNTTGAGYYYLRFSDVPVWITDTTKVVPVITDANFDGLPTDTETKSVYVAYYWSNDAFTAINLSDDLISADLILTRFDNSGTVIASRTDKGIQLNSLNMILYGYTASIQVWPSLDAITNWTASDGYDNYSQANTPYFVSEGIPDIYALAPYRYDNTKVPPVLLEAIYVHKTINTLYSWEYYYVDGVRRWKAIKTDGSGEVMTNLLTVQTDITQNVSQNAVTMSDLVKLQEQITESLNQYVLKKGLKTVNLTSLLIPTEEPPITTLVTWLRLNSDYIYNSTASLTQTQYNGCYKDATGAWVMNGKLLTTTHVNGNVVNTEQGGLVTKKYVDDLIAGLSSTYLSKADFDTFRNGGNENVTKIKYVTSLPTAANRDANTLYFVKSAS